MVMSEGGVHKFGHVTLRFAIFSGNLPSVLMVAAMSERNVYAWQLSLQGAQTMMLATRCYWPDILYDILYTV